MIIHEELKEACYKDSIHIPVRCNIDECPQEASFFMCDYDYSNDFHLCSDHAEKLINEDGYYCHLDPETMTIEEIETGVYSCSEECPICNS